MGESLLFIRNAHKTMIMKRKNMTLIMKIMRKTSIGRSVVKLKLTDTEVAFLASLVFLSNLLVDAFTAAVLANVSE